MPLTIAPEEIIEPVGAKQEGPLSDEALRELREIVRERFGEDLDPEELALLVEEIQDRILQAAPLIRERVTSAFRNLSGLDFEGLVDSVRRLDESGARAAFVPLLDRIRRDLTGDGSLSILPPIERAVEAGGIMGEGLMMQIGIQPTFDPADRFVVEWIEKHSAELVREITEETRQAINETIRRAFVEGEPPREAGRIIRQILRPEQLADHIVNKVGLTRRQATAVDNFLAAQLDDGTPRSLAIRRANRYSNRLLRVRGETIARTEILKAANRGTQESFEQALRDGLIDPKVHKKMWLTAADDRVCPICGAMEGEIVEIREEYDIDIRYSEGGDVVRTIHEIQPPAHPNCRCQTVLITT